MKRRLLATVLALCMVLGMLPGTAWTAEKRDFIIPVSSKTQVPNGYVGVYTVEDLRNIKSDLAGKYILMNDINLSSWGNWEPIGGLTGRDTFTGILDGNGYSVSGMRMEYSDIADSVACGLFATTSNARIENLKIDDAHIRISSQYNVYCGIIAGQSLYSANSASIDNCIVTSSSISVEAAQNCYIGGITGFNGAFLDIDNCISFVNIECNNTDTGIIGGILGGTRHSSSATIKKCINYGNIKFSGNDGATIGGLVGGPLPKIENCVNNGSIEVSSASCYVGGIAGSCSDCINTYNTGSISANIRTNMAFVGGIAGKVGSIPHVRGCYTIGDIDVSASKQGAGVIGVVESIIEASSNPGIDSCYYINSELDGIGSNYSNRDPNTMATLLTSDEMMVQDNFSGFDFTRTWSMGTGQYRYPVLQAFSQKTVAPISAPKIVLTTPANMREGGTAIIKWDPVAGADKYYYTVQIGAASLNQYLVKDKPFDNSICTLELTNLAANEYRVFVYAEKGGVKSEASNTISLLVTAETPPTPELTAPVASFSDGSTTASITEGESITVQWDKVEGAASYYIKLSTSTVPISPTISQPTSGTKVTYDFKPEEAGTYRVQVVAVADGETKQSNELALTVTAPPMPELSAPVVSFSDGSTTATIKDGESIKLQWDKVEGASHYFVRLLPDILPIGSPISQPASGTKVTYDFKPATAGTYRLTVTAAGDDQVKVSNEVTLTVTSEEPPDNPSTEKPGESEKPGQSGNPGGSTSEIWSGVDPAKKKLVENLTEKSLEGVRQDIRDDINKKIYDLLYVAQFRPNYVVSATAKELLNVTSSHDPFGVYDNAKSQRAVNADWPAPNNKRPVDADGKFVGWKKKGTWTGNNKWPDPDADKDNGWVEYLEDKGLGQKYEVGDGKTYSKGCFAHCRYASMYCYGTCGTEMPEKIVPSLSNEEKVKQLKELINKYADPGEHIRITGKPNDHSVVFLGADVNNKGFFFTSYGDGITDGELGPGPYGDGIYGPTIEICYLTYEGFIYTVKKDGTVVPKYGNRTISLYDTNGGRLKDKYPKDTVDTSIQCPVDASITLGIETLNSTSLKDGETCTASFGSMTRNGEGIDLTVDYRTDYDFQIWGTGTGEMTLAVRYNVNGVTTTRTFASVPITAATRITTSPFNASNAFSLYVNSGGVNTTIWSAGINQTVYQADTDIPTTPTYPDTYYISIPQFTGGTITPSTRHAEPGERVTLHAHPDTGYELDTLIVTNIRGREISLRDLGDGRYSFTMPDTRVSVEASFVKITDNTSSASTEDEPFTSLGTPGISGIVLNPAAMPFTDVRASDWFYDNVEYMWKHYLMSGVSDTQFAPNATTSRAMIWTVLARMNNVRTDVNPGSIWYERGMLWAMERGVTDGTNPMQDITREQLATMLWRNAGSPGVAADLGNFSDNGNVSSYALGAVRWAVANGILKGADGKLNPKGTATRAQVAAMVMRYGERIGA